MYQIKRRYLYSIILTLLLIIILYIPAINVCAFSGSKISDISLRGAAEIPGNASATDAEYIPSDAPVINAESAIVMDIDTGDILYEKAAYTERYPASITKVLTCLIAIRNGNVNDTLTISESVMNQTEEGSSSIGLVAGEQLTLRDALYGMMLNSGNECALSIAEYIGGSTEGFADMMNKTARELGCKASNFVNPNGLQNENHYTCCYDMALIGIAAYQYPEFKKLISSQSYEIPETNMNEARALWQENRLIYSGNGEYYYQYSTGGKTGYTTTSLATLISFAERDGRRLVTVVMKCNPTTESYLDTIKLDEFCFNSYKLCKPLFSYDINKKNQNNILILDNYYNDINHDIIKYYVNQSYSFYTRASVNDNDIIKRINFYNKPVDNVAGKIEFLYNNEVIGETEITDTVPYVEASSTDALKKIVKQENKDVVSIREKIIQIIKILIILVIVVLLIFVLILIYKWNKVREIKRTIKYYPVKRDIRKNKTKSKKDTDSKEKTDNIDNGKIIVTDRNGKVVTSSKKRK